MPGFAESIAVVWVNDGSGAFVKATEEHGAKVHGPDAVVDLIEPDVLARENMTAVDPPAAPPDAAVRTDKLDLVVSGVLELRQPVRIGSWRWGIERRRAARGA